MEACSDFSYPNKYILMLIHSVRFPWWLYDDFTLSWIYSCSREILFSAAFSSAFTFRLWAVNGARRVYLSFQIMTETCRPFIVLKWRSREIYVCVGHSKHDFLTFMVKHSGSRYLFVPFFTFVKRVWAAWKVNKCKASRNRFFFVSSTGDSKNLWTIKPLNKLSYRDSLGAFC